MIALLSLLACGEPAAELKYPELVDDLLARVDTDKDGQVGAEEYALVAAETEPITLYDRDQDGALSRAELESMFLTATVNKKARGQSGPPQGGQGMGGPGMPGMPGGPGMPGQPGGPGMQPQGMQQPPKQQPPSPPVAQ